LKTPYGLKISISSFSYKWFIPFTHSVEKLGSLNSNTFSLNPNNLWEKVTWFSPNEATSKTFIYLTKNNN
jgi:hypothetical protein